MIFAKKIISSSNAPLAIGPYSQAVQWQNLIYTSGQIPIDPITSQVFGADIQAQTEQVLKNLRALLSDSGSSLDQVIKTTVYLKNMTDFTGMNEVYAQFFVERHPARSTVEVARLPKDVLVEIEAVAYIK